MIRISIKFGLAIIRQMNNLKNYEQPPTQTFLGLFNCKLVPRVLSRGSDE